MSNNQELFGDACISKLEPLTILPKAVNIKPPKHGSRVYSKEDQAVIDEELDRLLNAGYIVPSKTPFTSPHMVSLNNGKTRVCVDFRKMNSLIQDSKHVMPVIENLIFSLRGSGLFSRLDLRKGYNQLSFEPNSQKY